MVVRDYTSVRHNLIFDYEWNYCPDRGEIHLCMDMQEKCISSVKGWSGWA
ncbi:Uncharacterised protein [Vibrio cholerae]|nr:Uncharacterised protein [Vibrio cholerae]